MASISKAGRSFSNASLLWARLQDAIRLSGLRRGPGFVGFLDERERAEAERLLSRELRLPEGSYGFFGGYEGAERTYLGLFPDGELPPPAEYPLGTIAFHYRKDAALTHRDFLGGILSCGIRRDKLGDILCGSGEHAGLAVVFLEKDLVAFLSGQLDRIGREGVRPDPDYTGELPLTRQYEEMTDTVASPRLDAVVKVMIRASREAAARLIETGQVEQNHIPCLTVSAVVKEGDTLSIRGRGRFLVDRIGPPTKKGRLFLSIRRCL